MAEGLCYSARVGRRLCLQGDGRWGAVSFKDTKRPLRDRVRLRLSAAPGGGEEERRMTDGTTQTPASPAAASTGGAQSGTRRTGIVLLEQLVKLVETKRGSDIHLLEGERPRVRIHGELIPVDVKGHETVTRQDILDVLEGALQPEQRRIFDEKSDIDFSLEFADATGRVNVGYANGRRLHFVMRYLQRNIIPIDGLGIDPAMLRRLAETENGVIIVAGETSSGKTTTIAAMLDHINHLRQGSILTIENPVEYYLASNKCLITRREIGRDTPDFSSALRATVRKNPDVLLIGEVRDAETANIALSAAETGIQTFCTLHAIGAVPAVLRLHNLMTGSGTLDEGEFRLRISQSLRGIISQQLVRAADGDGVIPIYEVLNITYAEKSYLHDFDMTRLEHSLEADHNISMGQCVYNLWYATPRRINEDTIRRLYPDQYSLMMNRLGDVKGWKPLVTAI